jgi:hypothetical protein
MGLFTLWSHEQIPNSHSYSGANHLRSHYCEHLEALVITKSEEALVVVNVVLRTQRKYKAVGKITPEALSDIHAELKKRNISTDDESITDAWGGLFYPLHYHVSPEERQIIKANLNRE